jgi:hypothetical protein
MTLTTPLDLIYFCTAICVCFIMAGVTHTLYERRGELSLLFAEAVHHSIRWLRAGPKVAKLAMLHEGQSGTSGISALVNPEWVGGKLYVNNSCDPETACEMGKRLSNTRRPLSYLGEP